MNISILNPRRNFALRNFIYWDFPGGPVVKNPSCNARDAGLIPGQGTKIPHAAGQLSLHAATIKTKYSGACVPQLQTPHALEPVKHN